MRKKISSIILAAGYSSRMGVAKMSLKYDKKYSFLEKAVNEYREFGCTEIIIVVNSYNKEIISSQNLPEDGIIKIVVNEHPEFGRFYSLKTACLSVKPLQASFIHNVDNPFVTQETLNRIFEFHNKFDYIIPSFSGRGGHPVLISEKVVSEAASTKSNTLHLKEFLTGFSTYKVDVEDEKVLVNINNAEDYKRYFG